MNEFDRIKAIKQLYDTIYSNCLNRYDASQAMLKSDLVTGGYINNNDGDCVIFSREYLFVTDDSAIYKRIK